MEAIKLQVRLEIALMRLSPPGIDGLAMSLSLTACARAEVERYKPDARSRAITAETIGAQFNFSFNRRNNDPDLTYTPQVSSDLTIWHDGLAHVEEVDVTPMENDMERVTCAVTAAWREIGHGFCRVDVTIAQ